MPGHFVLPALAEIADDHLAVSNDSPSQERRSCCSTRGRTSFCGLPYFILRFPVATVNADSPIQGQANIEWPAQLTLHCLGLPVWHLATLSHSWTRAQVRVAFAACTCSTFSPRMPLRLMSCGFSA